MKKCTYSRTTNDRQINLSCYLVFLLWYVELKYLIKCPKSLKTGSFAPWAPSGLCPGPRPQPFGPPFNKSKIPQWHVLEIVLYAWEKGSYSVFVLIYNYMVYLPVLGFQLLGGLHWTLITAITGSEATSLLWTWNCCVSNVSLQC